MRRFISATLLAAAVACGGVAIAAPASGPRDGGAVLMPFPAALRRADGEAGVRTGEVKGGEVLVSIPVAYRRTGVVTRDVKGRDLIARLTGETYAHAGDVGYWAGSFQQAGVFRGPPRRQGDVWCLFAKKADGRNVPGRCFMASESDHDGKYALVGYVRQSQLVRSFRIEGAPALSDMPVMDERPVEIVPDLHLDYVLGRWLPDRAELQVLVGGELVETVYAPRAPDGCVTMITPAGLIRLAQPDPQDDRRASVTRAAAQAPAPPSVARAVVARAAVAQAAPPPPPPAPPRPAARPVLEAPAGLPAEL